MFAWTFTVCFVILVFVHFCLGVDVFWWMH